MLAFARRVCLALAALALWGSAACSDTTAPRGGRLLTDEQLRTPLDTLGPSVDTAYVAWIQTHHQPIRSLTSDDFSDLQFLKPLLSGKRLVLLGESGHGVSEFSTAKARLIRFLHEQLGFDVLAFESGAFECNYANGLAGSGKAVMQQSIFGVWWVREAEPLFDYLVASRQSRSPLTLAGFDVQMSSVATIRGRPATLGNLMQRADPAYATRAYLLDSAFVAGATSSSGGPEAWAAQNPGAAAAYDSIARFLSDQEQTILAGHPGDSTLVRIVRVSMRGMRAYLAELRNPAGETGYEARDSGMARVAEFLADSVYRGHRIILWAHNYHIRNKGPGATPQSWVTMGTVLAQHRRTEMYTIGFYMYQGTAALNSGEVYQVSRPLPNSLEAILHRTRRMYAFADLSRAGHGTGTGWIWQRTPSFDWGMTVWNFTPGDQYDGIFFVDTTHPPTYLTN